MTYIKINEILYPATINGKIEDRDWDKRESKTIILEMDYATAMNIFVDGLAWSIVTENQFTNIKTDENGEIILDAEGNPMTETVENIEEFDNSDFCIAGAITDNRDGTLAIKMGKPTEIETMQSQLANAITEEELNAAYVEGVNSL